MPLTDPVPSSSFDVLERNIQDTDKFVNQEVGTFTNRVGKEIKPIPVIESEANAAVISLGWHQVGLFSDGFTYTLQNDIAKDSLGDWYRWNGTLPKVVTSGTLPSSDTNFVKIDYKSHADLSDRNPADGSAHNADDVAKNGGGSVQDFIDAQYSTVAELATGKFHEGMHVRLTDRDLGVFLVQSGGTATGKGILTAGFGRTAVLQMSESTTPLQAGAIGDSVANDQGAFDYLETFSGYTVDLLGKTYLVERLPSNNAYINGIISVDNLNLFPQRYVKGQAYNKAQFNLKRDYADSRHTADVVPALRKSTVVLGTSISHGAYQGNLYANGYVNLLKRMFNAENGNSANGSYGLIPLLSWNTAPNNNTVDIHQIIFTGSPPSIFTKNGECLLNSLAFECTGAQSVKTTIPTFQQTCRIWYLQDPSYGTMEVLVNGVVVTTVNTSGTFDLAANTTVPITDNGFGACVIEVRASAGTIAFSGFGYEYAGNVLNNLSQSGRKLIDLTEGCIKKLCSAANLIVELGHNDVGVVDGNPANEALFSDNIDLLIEWATYFNTNVVVPDCCWWTEFTTSHVRKELKRLADATSGTYVPLPEYLTRDLRNKREFGDAFYLVSTTKMFHDASHPNQLGAQWIAETIAKEIGLKCNTKSEAMDYHDFWMALQLDSAVIKNRLTAVPNISSVRKNGNSYQYNISVARLSAGALPVGTYVLNITGGLKVPTVSNSVSFGVGGMNGTTVLSKYSIGQQGDVTLYVDVALLNFVNFSFQHVCI